MIDTDNFRTIPPKTTDLTMLKLPPMSEETLPGGIVLKIYDNCDTPVSGMSIISEGGSAESGNANLALLYGTMMREGSVNHTAAGIAEMLEHNGAVINTKVLNHHHQLELFTPNSRWNESFAVAADIFKHPVMEEAAFIHHREAAAKKLEIDFKKVKYLAERRMWQITEGDSHPLATSESPEGIMELTRDNLLQLSRKFDYAPTTIYLTGQIDTTIVESVKKAFGNHPATSRNGGLNIEPFRFNRHESIEIVDVDGAQQSAVAMRIPAIPRSHPDYDVLHIVVNALGGYFGSRLMLNIRENKGYTYGIRAGLFGYREGAFIGISAECDNRMVNRLIDEVAIELHRMATEPPQGEEFKRLKQATISSMLEMLETPFTIGAAHTLEQTLAIKPDFVENKCRVLAAITPERLAETAALYLNRGKMNVVVAGDARAMQ